MSRIAVATIIETVFERSCMLRCDTGSMREPRVRRDRL
jgi:hypothetical protein